MTASTAPAIALDCGYRYDASGLLTCQAGSEGLRWRFWRGATPCTEWRPNSASGAQLTWLHAAGQPIGEQIGAQRAHLTLLAIDLGGSVLLEADGGVRPVAYAPHGFRSGGEGDGARVEPAFNGELLDSASGCYLLGASHHRPYSPTLGMFLAPDSLSPFADGGLNAYAYCEGDPINRSDPSGQFWKWIVAGIAVVAAVATLGVMAAAGAAALTASAVVGATLITASAGLEVAAALVQDEKLSMALGIAGAVMGLAGGVAAGAAVVKGATNIKARGGRFLSRLGTTRRAGEGRNASRGIPRARLNPPPGHRFAGSGAGNAPPSRVVDMTGNRFTRRSGVLPSAVNPDAAFGLRSRVTPAGAGQPPGRLFQTSPASTTLPAPKRGVRFSEDVTVHRIKRTTYPDDFLDEVRKVPDPSPSDVAWLMESADPDVQYIRELVFEMGLKP